MQVCWIFLLSAGFLTFNTGILRLEGLPLQMRWTDVNGDGEQDLIALMLETETQAQVDTYFAGGGLRGTYAEETTKEKVLITCLMQGGHWTPENALRLGKGSIPGFEVNEDHPGRIYLWREHGLFLLSWDSSQWSAKEFLLPPQRAIDSPISLSDFSFISESNDGPVWLVPDVHGIHLVGNDRRFVDYPARHGTTYYRHGSPTHTLRMRVPELMHIDGDAYPDLVLTGRDRVYAHTINNQQVFVSDHTDGILVDLNNDRLADLVVIEEHDDVDKLRDLPDMKSTVKTYLAHAPLEFHPNPTADQQVPGIVFSTEDETLNMTDPFFDINGDKHMDLAGVAVKLSAFQIAKLISLGRMKVQFLLHLSVQEDDGTFRTLANGPFKMVWRINLRRLELPRLAQITADFDGDGWTDVFTSRDKDITIVPITSQGFQTHASMRIKIPTPVREPDSVFGRDTDGDGKAEFIIVKSSTNATKVAHLREVW